MLKHRLPINDKNEGKLTHNTRASDMLVPRISKKSPCNRNWEPLESKYGAAGHSVKENTQIHRPQPVLSR